MGWISIDPLRRPQTQHKQKNPAFAGFLDYLDDIGLQIGAPGGIRTHDHRLRRAVLYPAELQAHCVAARGGADGRHRGERKYSRVRRGGQTCTAALAPGDFVQAGAEECFPSSGPGEHWPLAFPNRDSLWSPSSPRRGEGANAKSALFHWRGFSSVARVSGRLVSRTRCGYFRPPW